ncbi:MAG TPA: BamA/TamA family outer membrane protein [Steroidobacteraceae bacterium]|nr:BamA/TamA family outer membrane protein [Steroidobacteraceae bacterium]
MPLGARALDFSRWLNPATSPFVPIPLIETDPDSGHTLGLIPAWLHSDEHGNITRILAAPQLYHNSYFGAGLGASLYDYPSADQQWSLQGDIERYVERTLDFNYQLGIQRQQPLSLTARVLYDRNGTPRFFGIGNNTTLADQTNYTSRTELAEATPGWNINQHLQLGYMLQAETVTVMPGSIPTIASIERRFGRLNSLGTVGLWLHRLVFTWDTRDSLNLPTRGTQVTIYGGMAARGGFANDSLYSEAGVEAREYLDLGHQAVLALHSSLRYVPHGHRLPFWALSSIGGDRAYLGGPQPLRGFGLGRFTDRNAFSFSAELRRQVASFDVMSSHVELQLAPFVDTGRVFARPGTNPLSKLHTVAGLGMRGLAPPFVVGYVDIGYGSEGAAVFTGINYPF